MTPEQMRTKSAEKVKQVMAMMEMLHLKVEAREKMDQGGFIEKIVFWIDDEKYPAIEAVPVPEETKVPEATDAEHA